MDEDGGRQLQSANIRWHGSRVPLKEHHGTSVHIGSCVVLECWGSSVHCSLDEGRTVVTHGSQLVLELRADRICQRERVVMMIALELQPCSRVEHVIIISDPFLHRFSTNCSLHSWWTLAQHVSTRGHSVRTILPINANSTCTLVNFDRQLSSCGTLTPALLSQLSFNWTPKFITQKNSVLMTFTSLL